MKKFLLISALCAFTAPMIAIQDTELIAMQQLESLAAQEALEIADEAREQRKSIKRVRTYLKRYYDREEHERPTTFHNYASNPVSSRTILFTIGSICVAGAYGIIQYSMKQNEQH
jgi:hypothetical protein